MKKTSKAIAALAIAIATVLAFAAPTQAAAWYTYYVGHPMRSSPTALGCTGGYVITGSSGMFMTTAGHCFNVSQTVYGTDTRFGWAAYKKPTTAGDSLLVRADAGVDMRQRIVDPHTGKTPSVSGYVVGVVPTSQQVKGLLVGKMGRTTGWEEGRITHYSTVNNRQVICTDAFTLKGDSGGPVWRNDQNGLRAVGMTLTYFEDRSGGCYMPIEQLLNEWGASLPVASGASISASPESLSKQAAPSETLPWIDPAKLVPAG